MKKVFLVMLALVATMSISAQTVKECYDSTLRLGFHEGVRYDDLGLPSGTMWANENLQAEHGGDAGEYLMSDKCNHEGKDPISENLKGDWQIPTIEQWKELIDNCTYCWSNIDGREGVFFQSKINKQTLFLPAHGFKATQESAVSSDKTSAIFLVSNRENPEKQNCILIDTKKLSFLSTNKDIMCTVRAVFVKK